MNPLLIPVILGTPLYFVLGVLLARNIRSSFQKKILAAIGFVAATPAFLFVIYYTGVLGEAGWFYSFRSIPGSEFAGCGAGILAGCVQFGRTQSPFFRKQMSAVFIPFILLLCVAIPYLKQIFCGQTGTILKTVGQKMYVSKIPNPPVAPPRRPPF